MIYDMNFPNFKKLAYIVQYALKITSNRLKNVCFAHFWTIFRISVSVVIHKIPRF